MVDGEPTNGGQYIVPPLPDYEKKTGSDTTTTSGGTNETKKLSAEQESALAAEDKVTEERIAATGEVSAQKKAELGITSDAASDAARIGTLQDSRLQNALIESQGLIDKARARATAKQAELDAAPPVSYFKSGDTWHNAVKGIALAMGGIGDAIQKAAMVRIGHAPPTIDSVGEIINRDLEGQKERIAQLKDSAVMAATGIRDAHEARQQMLSDVELKGAAAYSQLERLTRARLAAQQLSAPDIEQHQAILSLKEARAAHHAKYVEPLFQTITKKVETAKKQSQEEINRVPKVDAKSAEAAAQAPALAEAYKEVAGFDPGMLEGVTPNALKDPEAQKFGAGEQRVKAALMGEMMSKRGMTSEAAGKMYDEMYGIRPTDKPETRKWKRENMLRDLDAVTAGGVSRNLGGPRPTAEAPAAVPAPAAPAAPAPADRSAKLREGAAAIQRIRAKNPKDPRLPAAEAKLRALIHGG